MALTDCGPSLVGPAEMPLIRAFSPSSRIDLLHVINLPLLKMVSTHWQAHPDIWLSELFSLFSFFSAMPHIFHVSPCTSVPSLRTYAFSVRFLRRLRIHLILLAKGYNLSIYGVYTDRQLFFKLIFIIFYCEVSIAFNAILRSDFYDCEGT